MKSIIQKRVLLEFVKYSLVGVIGTALHTLTLYIGVEYLSLNPLLSSSLGFILSLLVSYLLNSAWTFDSGSNVRILVKYIIVCLSGFLLNLVLIYLFSYVILHNYMYGQYIAIILVPLFNFALNKIWAFKEQKVNK